MALLPWQIAVITSVEQATDNTRRFYFEVKDCNKFDFIPGQFVTFDLPIHEKQSKRVRSYSIASCPDGTNQFELVIVWLEGGAGTTYLFNEGKPGLEIQFRGPLGHFTLPEKPERELCLICTGTGVAPFRAQMNYCYQNNISIPRVHLIFGSRFKKDILYYDELKQLEEKLPNFHYHVTLSRESTDEWTGKHGYVHAVYEELCQGGKRDMDFYLCGWKVMIDEARQRLANMGFSKDRIHLELYG
jgi:CDP-4-dehydro-6-deoxyglucose reductase